jgi:hypothetical protein
MAARRRIFTVILVVLMGVVLGCFLFRDQILHWAFTRAQTRIHEGYKAKISASSITFSGLNTIVIRNLSLTPDDEDTFLRVSEAEMSISLIDLLQAKIAFGRIHINGAVFTVYNEDGRNNISFLRAAAKTPKTTSSGFRKKAANWEAKLFGLLNTGFDARDIEINYQDSASIESVYIPSFTYDLHTLSGHVINQRNADTISIDGVVVQRKEAYQCTIRNIGNDTAYLPFLDRKNGLRCRFKSITADINFDNGGDVCRVSTDAALENLHINHWRLAKGDVVLPQAQFRGDFSFTDDAAEMDSSSMVRLGSVPCHLFARYELRPDTTFTLGIHMPETASDSFFQALPVGMFHTLRGISCTGTLVYDLNFTLHTNNPDSLVFNSLLRPKDFRISHFGAEDYTRINEPFTYEAYDKEVLMRRLTIGPENPNFTPLSQMSPYLPQAVLQAEDPSFMQHRGFLADAFRESIAKNYKEHRFARGGSTISMQLVKNVFLSRDKTVSRKAEEALIVYLIENLGLVPKERMLEVYLNVIEWGPNVYGIGEAARFYFSKKPSELTLPESLYLASIIPRPKSFRYEFDEAGQLRPSMGDYFKILTTRMVWRGVLNPSDTIGLEPKVTLKGTAMHTFLPRDSTIEETDNVE